MDGNLERNLEVMMAEGKLPDRVILWGIGNQTDGLIEYLRAHEIQIECIVDNFKCTYYREYRGIPVYDPETLCRRDDEITVLLAIKYADAVRKQLRAYGVKRIINLCHLDEPDNSDEVSIPYRFEDRRGGKRVLCYILAGYQEFLWDNVLTRIKLDEHPGIDYCLVSSGLYSEKLAHIAEEYHWSYLATEVNQVAYIQNLVIELHPQAERIFKFDEDIFISKGFFGDMLAAMDEAEAKGEYRIGFMAPVIPLNCAGYVSYLDAVGKKSDFEQRFGRAYRSRYSAVFQVPEAAEYMWSTMDHFDTAAAFFTGRKGDADAPHYRILYCYYNIGCILFTRRRWLMMGKWPVIPETSGMGVDEETILRDNAEKDMAIYEVQNVLAGHFAFGHQKSRMEQFYREHAEIFESWGRHIDENRNIC